MTKPPIVPLIEASKEAAELLKRDQSRFYQALMRYVRKNKDAVVGRDMPAAIVQHGRHYRVFKISRFLSWARETFGINPESFFKTIDPAWSFEDFLNKKGVFALSEFAYKFGEPVGPLRLKITTITPSHIKDEVRLKNLGFVRIGPRWGILMPKFKNYLNEFGYLDRYWLEKELLEESQT